MKNTLFLVILFMTNYNLNLCYCYTIESSEMTKLGDKIEVINVIQDNSGICKLSDASDLIALNSALQNEQKNSKEDEIAQSLKKFFFYINIPTFNIKVLKNLQVTQQLKIFNLIKPENSKIFKSKSSVTLNSMDNKVLKYLKTKSSDYDWETKKLDSALMLYSFMLSDTIIEINLPKDKKSFQYFIFDSVLKSHGVKLNELQKNKVIIMKNFSILLYSHLNLFRPKLFLLNTGILFYNRNEIHRRIEKSNFDIEEENILNFEIPIERESSNLYCYSLTGGFGVDVLNSIPAILGKNRIFSGFYDGIDGFASGNIRYEVIFGDPQNKENLQLNSRINLVNGRFQGMSNIITSINYRSDMYSFGPILYIDNSKPSNIVPGINFCLHTQLNYFYKFNENNDLILEPDFESDDITFQIIYFPNFNSISPLLFESNFLLTKNIDNRSSKLDFVYSIGASYYVISGSMFEKSNKNFYGGFKINFQIGVFKKGQGSMI